MNFLRGIVVLIALGTTGSALADVEIYIGGSYGSADAGAKPGNVENTLVSKGYDVTGVMVDSEDSGWRFVAGLSFTEIFGVELGFVDLGDVSTVVNANVAPTSAASFNQDVANALPVMPRGITLAGVARFNVPAIEQLDVALKLGVIDADSEREASGGARGSDSVNASPYYGVVAGWNFTDSWRGTVGYEIFNLADSTEYLSVGVEFKFPAYSSR